VTGTILPDTIKTGEEISIVCFMEMPCVLNDLTTKQWNDKFELNCSDNCAVIRLHDDVPDPHNSNRMLYIIIGICSGIVILIATIITAICIKRRKSKPPTEEVFTPLTPYNQD
jgi:hypothetical protein